MRTEEKKREAARLKEAKASPAETSVVAETPAVDTPAPAAPSTEIAQDAPSTEVKAEDSIPVTQVEEVSATATDADPAAQQDVPQQSIEVR